LELLSLPPPPQAETSMPNRSRVNLSTMVVAPQKTLLQEFIYPCIDIQQYQLLEIANL
jgi:hypothetical protein